MTFLALVDPLPKTNRARSVQWRLPHVPPRLRLLAPSQREATIIAAGSSDRTVSDIPSQLPVVSPPYPLTDDRVVFHAASARYCAACEIYRVGQKKNCALEKYATLMQRSRKNYTDFTEMLLKFQRIKFIIAVFMLSLHILCKLAQLLYAHTFYPAVQLIIFSR